MQKGYNSDVTVRGQKFHIQTEDWGAQNPYVVSRIFSNGAVVKTIKTSYEIILQTGPQTSSDAIKIALQKQHHQIIDKLMAGQQL